MGALCGLMGHEPALVQAMAHRIAHRAAGPPTIHELDGITLASFDGGFAAGRCHVLIGDCDIPAGSPVPPDGAPTDAEGARPLAPATTAGAIAALLAIADSDRPAHDLPVEIEGDFAIALVEHNTGRVVLARDRAGARPLYYTFWQGRVAFASEYKALLALPGLQRSVDLASLQQLQASKTVPADATLLDGVHQVPAGSYVVLEPGRAVERAQTNRYWTPALNLDRRSSFDALADEVRATFVDAVDARIADPIAISLSGGIDSIAILAAARRLRPDARILTFSAGDSEDDPELVRARRAVEHFRTEHHEAVFDPARLPDLMPVLVWHLEDPIARTETLMAYELCRIASSHASVLLRGDGADGLFAGMPRHRLLALGGRVAPARGVTADVYRFTQSGTRPDTRLGRLLVDRHFAKKIPPVPVVLGAPEPPPAAVLPSGPEMLNEVLVHGPRHALPMLLQKVERMHAAFGMRSLSPFTDSRMLALATRIPSRFKHDGRRDKKIFRRSMAGLLPPELAALPKHPQRIRETAPFCDALEQLADRWLTPDAVARRGLLDAGTVRRLLNRPAGGIWAPEHAMRIWTLIGTEIWAATFIDGDGGAPVRMPVAR